MSVRLLRSGAFLALIALGCGRKGNRVLPFCASDSDCGGTQVCFADGCGDPDRGVRVEVVPSTQEVQDFAPASLSGRLNFEVAGPTVIWGQMRQSPVDAPYSGLVSVQATGQSILIPGRTRVFSSQVQPNPVDGAFESPIGAGTYSLSATALTVSPPLPPFTARTVSVPTGGAVNQNFLFPSLDSLRRFRGQLVVCRVDCAPITESPMDVQAIELNGTRPISQRVRVSPSGDFVLGLWTSVTGFVLRAFPVSSTARVPSKDFPVSLDVDVSDQSPMVFDLGDYRSNATVTGIVVSSRGAPIANARFLLVGPVNGEGTLRVANIQPTDEAGRFSFNTLTNAPGASFTLQITPPSTSDSGILKTSVSVTASVDLGPLYCPDRVLVQGSIRRPDGTVAKDVQVTTEPVVVVDSYPLPSNGTRVVSDANGNFSFRLDPAVYLLSLTPGDQLPRVSRYVVIRPPTADIGSLTLSNGRRLNGVVTSRSNVAGKDAPVLSHVSLRFFRLASIYDAPSSVLIAETLSDVHANYSVVLPVR